MSIDDIKPGEQLTLAQINRLRKQAAQGVSGNADKADPVTGEGDPHKMNMPELKDWLTDQGIEFDAGAKKADLQALIPDPVTGEGDEKEDED